MQLFSAIAKFPPLLYAKSIAIASLNKKSPKGHGIPINPHKSSQKGPTLDTSIHFGGDSRGMWGTIKCRIADASLGVKSIVSTFILKRRLHKLKVVLITPTTRVIVLILVQTSKAIQTAVAQLNHD